MANVKFYRLGLNGGVSNASYLEYTSEMDGRIVFAQVKGENDSDSLEHYIWANGIEYHVADANALLKVEHTLNVLLDGAPADTSIGKMIQDALDGYELTAENFVKLVDSSNSNVQVRVVDSSIVLTAPGSHANIDVSTCDPEEYYQGSTTPEHGDYYVKEEALSNDPNIEPRRTAYIYNGDLKKWQALDGNVNAENVYFPEGFLRTQAWGTQTERPDVETDDAIIGKNLKEVFEFYLVKESWPTVTASTASAIPSAYSINGLNKPKNISTYINSTASLVEVGTQITFKGIELEENATHSGTTSYTSSQSKITGMKYGATTSYPGEVSTNIKNVYAGPITTSASYVDNFDSAMATISLNVSGFTSISNTTASVTVNGSTLSLDSSTGTIVEGDNKLTLSWSSNASVNRTLLDTDTSIPAMTYYYASNKGNLSSTQNKSTATVSWVDNSSTATVASTNSSITITGVYAIYTNGKKVTTSDSYTTINTGWYQDNYQATYSNKLPILNYYSNTQSDREIMLSFGLTNANNGYKCLIYVPTGMTFDVPEAAVYDSANKFEKWAPNTSRTSWVKQENTVTINSKAYDVYENDSLGVGTGSYKIVIGKKS